MMIVGVRTARSGRASELLEKQYQKACIFLQGEVRQNGGFKEPGEKLVQFLGDNFTIDTATARRNARMLLKRFLEEQARSCEPVLHGRKIVCLKTKEPEKPLPKPESPVIAEKAETPGIKKDHWKTIAKAIVKKRALGKSARKRLLTQREIGRANEKRFYVLMREIATLLPIYFPDTIKRAVCDQSGEHRPEEGIIDWRDSRGEDVSLELCLRPQQGADLIKWMIYDVKTIEEHAAAFNADIKLKSEYQRKALLKKAICVHHRRSDRSIVREVLNDIIAVGVLPPKIRKEDLLKLFLNIRPS